MESLQDMLLEHVVPDQKGELGKISYAFSEMKIVHVHWPRVSSSEGLFLATNGALRLQGKYQIRRPGIFGYTKSGEFIFDLSGICLSIKENKPGVPESPAHEYDDYSHHEKYLHHDRNEIREVACTVAHVKVKFHGGAAMICQFLTSLYIKMYKRQLEIQIASVIQETLKDDQQVLYSALTVMAAMHGESPDTLTASLPRRHRTLTHHTDTEQSPSRVQRFFSSFRRSHSTYS